MAVSGSRVHFHVVLTKSARGRLRTSAGCRGKEQVCHGGGDANFVSITQCGRVYRTATCHLKISTRLFMWPTSSLVTAPCRSHKPFSLAVKTAPRFHLGGKLSSCARWFICIWKTCPLKAFRNWDFGMTPFAINVTGSNSSQNTNRLSCNQPRRAPPFSAMDCNMVIAYPF